MWYIHKHHLKRHAFVFLRGVLLIIIVVALQGGGSFTRFEAMLYDERVRHCQAFRPPPTPTLVQLDVDDNALNYIGNWPWDRTKLARIVDEIALAKPRILTMDILFGEAKGIEYQKNDPTGVDADAQLAVAFSKLGCAVIPVSMKFDDVGAPSKLREHMLPLLVENPELTEAQCSSQLKSESFSDKAEAGSTDSYLQIREQAFYERIWGEVRALKDSPRDKAKIKQAMLPHADPRLTGTVLGNLFNLQYERVQCEQAILPFTLPGVAGLPPLIRPNSGIVPILPMARAAAYSGFVDYLPEDVEGTVRKIPLLVQYRDRLVPQMDLVTACAMLGADIHNLRLTTDTLTVPIPGKSDLVIPVSTTNSNTLGQVGALMEIPLFGRRDDWLTMYDFPKYQKQAQHVSAYEVWQICETLDKLATNDPSTDTLLENALFVLGQDEQLAKYRASPLKGPARKKLIQDTLDGDNGTAANIAGLAPNADSDPTWKKLLQDYKTADADLRTMAQQNDRLELQLAQLRKKLYDNLHNRAVFFGGTATGLLDLKPTSLFHSCPGIVIHGAIYNAIMTGKMWRMTPPTLDVLLTTAAGFLTLLLAATLSPTKGFLGSAGLIVGYLAFNGYYLFAYKNLVVNAAGPITAVAVVWAGMTLTSFLTEMAEKSRIKRRFQTYVDPRLVDLIADDPGHVRFDGETREITCCFSDLAGFTTLTDQMGPGIVKLLSEYMGEMIPVIRQHNGYVSQMAGDGIYFFFGAPPQDPSHAQNALVSAFEMYQALAQFNVTLKNRGLSQLGMRIGMATGEVIVGDTGPSDSCAYTAMGATVNLSSRLESANKVFGSRMLITARTAELLGGSYLIRPLANLRVAGKLNCVVVYEPLCRIADATEQDRKLVDATARVFEAYRYADFQSCLSAAADLEAAFGPSKFARLYTLLSTEHLNKCAIEEHCEGQIVLTEK